MRRSILMVLLAAAGTALVTNAADAGCRRWMRNNSTYYNSGWSGNNMVWSSTPTMAAPMTATPAPANGSVAAAPAPQNSQYQSYSFEPGNGANNQPVATAPVIRQAPTYFRGTNQSEYNSVLRGDRKVRGHTAENE